ncbi:MAG: hypothetical protein R2851_13425 [Caldilineaceae bacterium]
MTDAYIFDAIRTPRGKGARPALHDVKPVDLVAGLSLRVAGAPRWTRPRSTTSSWAA